METCSTELRTSPNAIDPQAIHRFVESLVAWDLHAKTVLSLGNGVVGAFHAATLGIHAIGQALAGAMGLEPKHATKQVDRLLSNPNFDVWELLRPWVRFCLAARTEAIVALDWTEFANDDHATIALHMITTHGRTTPLVWLTVRKSELANNRNAYEDRVIDHFWSMVPRPMRVTLLADRGFGDQVLYQNLSHEGIDFIIRFRSAIHVTAEGKTEPASKWVPEGGRVRMLRGAKVTHERTPVGAVVCVQRKGMKEPWCLATSRADLTAAEIVALYGRRFTIEEKFRDIKDPRYGMGLSATHISKPRRRDRILFLGALAEAMLTLLGAAAEDVGLDKKLKANTVKKRTHSLLRQGIYWYGAIPKMRREWIVPLMQAFNGRISAHAECTEILGVI
jgi:hypothetical protein